MFPCHRSIDADEGVPFSVIQSDNLYFMTPLFIKASKCRLKTKQMCVASKLNYALDECGFQLAESRLTLSR